MKPNADQNGYPRHWVVVRPEPPGQYTAQVVGLPEIRSTAATRELAIAQAGSILSDWLALGKLVPIDVPCPNPLLSFPGHLDPNDPVEREFQDELRRLHQEDLDRTLREYDQECPNSSSTPTT